MAKTPTTNSTAQEFKLFLQEMSYGTHQIVEAHAKAHEQAHRELRHDGYSYHVRNSSCPDVDSMSMAYSVCIDFLWGMVNEIIEAEQRLEYVEDDPDSEEYQHAIGEVFGAKSVFLAVHTRMINLESSRIQATRQGRNQRAFLGDVLRAEGETIQTADERPYSWGRDSFDLPQLTAPSGGIRIKPNTLTLKDLLI